MQEDDADDIGDPRAHSAKRRRKAPRVTFDSHRSVQDGTSTHMDQPDLMTRSSARRGDVSHTPTASHGVAQSSSSSHVHSSAAASVGVDNSRLARIMKLKGGARAAALAKYAKEQNAVLKPEGEVPPHTAVHKTKSQIFTAS